MRQSSVSRRVYASRSCRARVARRVLVAPGQRAATMFCHVALSGHLTPVRVAGVSVRPVTLSRHPLGAHSCCGRWARRVKVCNATGRAVAFWVSGALGAGRLPLPLFFPLSPFTLFSGSGEAPLRLSGVVEAGARAERRAWSEEKVANRREGPLVGSFFVKGRDFLCPLPSGWIGSPSGFIDSFTAFPMLASLRRHPGRARPYRGALGGRDKDRCRDLVSRRDRVAVATRCLVASGFVSRCPSPSRWYRDGLWGRDSASGVFVARLCVGVCPRAGLALRTFCQRFVVVLIVLPRMFARCLALEGLSHSEVVSIAWDPHPQEPVEVHLLVALCSGGGFPELFVVVLSGALVVLVEDCPLSLLVEVLPRSALYLFRATVVLPLWFEVCRLVGLHSGEVLPGQLLALLVESAWALSVKVSCPWLCVWLPRWPACLVSHSGLRFIAYVSPSSTFRRLLGVVVLHYDVVLPGCASRQSRCSVFCVLLGADVVVALLKKLSAFRVLLVALSVVRQALVVACVPVFPLACGASVCDCGTLLRSGSLEVDVLSLTSAVVSVPAWLFVFLVVGMLVPALSSVLMSVLLVTVRPIGLLALDHVVCRRCEVPSFGLTSDVFHVSVAVCPVVERVVSQCCGSACLWCPCQTTRTVWVRPSGDSGYRFRMLRFLRVCLLSLLDREEGVSRVAVGNCALYRVLPAIQWVADLLVPTVRSVGGCSRAVFGWLFPLFGLDLASLGTCGVVIPFRRPFVWRE
ncbi:hypothetical protein Taro_039901 [Colocasia esculenta]|uniref:Uncharacterized protein n=1 Tax=Colocasia esculenta TaxID=4460 RepID=A0A843WH44_COLES|nr:hypothetical protein [Colocasia esculenta]